MKNSLMFLLMLFGMNAYADINKWVDENNQVHYSDGPPPVSTKSDKLRSASGTKDSTDARGATATSGPAVPKTIAEREALLKKEKQAKKEASDKAAQKQANEAANKANCAQAQQVLKTLEADMRIKEVDAKGEQVYLNDEQRQQRIAKTKKDINSLCK